MLILYFMDLKKLMTADLENWCGTCREKQMVSNVLHTSQKPVLMSNTESK